MSRLALVFLALALGACSTPATITAPLPAPLAVAPAGAALDAQVIAASLLGDELPGDGDLYGFEQSSVNVGLSLDLGRLWRLSPND